MIVLKYTDCYIVHHNLLLNKNIYTKASEIDTLDFSFKMFHGSINF